MGVKRACPSSPQISTNDVRTRLESQARALEHRYSNALRDKGATIELHRGKACYELLFRGSSCASIYSRPSGPIAVTCVTYSPDFAQWKCQVSPGRTMTLPGGYASTLLPLNCSPSPI